MTLAFLLMLAVLAAAIVDPAAALLAYVGLLAVLAIVLAGYLALDRFDDWRAGK